MDNSRFNQPTGTRRHGLRRCPLAVACLLITMSGAAAAAAAAADAPQGALAAAGQSRNASAAQAKKEKAKKKPIATLNAVVVTGIRGSIENSLQIKQDSDDIVEVITAEDIGKLPDASIAESLSRLPGLATQRGADGMANKISIRGMSSDFVGTTLNGREEASTGENRGVDYNQYPAELISGVTVYKTPDATLVGQGLSGTINLHTIRPLDFKKMELAANLRGEWNSNGSQHAGAASANTGHRASISFIDQFLDHTLGVAVGFAQLATPVQQKQYQSWWWSVDNGSAGIDQNWGGPHTAGLPDNALTQEGMQLRARSENQLRNSLMSVIEWQPGNDFTSTLDLFYSTFDKRSYINGLQWSSTPWDGISYSNPGTSSFQPYPLITSGTLNGLKPIMQNEDTHEKDHLFSVGWKNEFKLPGGWSTTTDLSYSSARVNLHDAYLFTGLANGGTMNAQFNLPTGYGYPTFSPGVNLANPSNVVFTDPDNYGYNGREEFDHQTDKIKSVRLDFVHEMGWIFDSVDIGFDYSDRKKTKNANVLFAWLNGNGSTQGTYSNTYSMPINSGNLYGSTSLGYGGIPGIVNYSVLGALASQFYLTQKNGQNDWNRNYSVEEKVPLGYLMLNVDTMLGDVPIRGNVGVQYVHTDQSSVAYQTTGSQVAGTLRGGTTYNNVLPSLNLVADLGNRQYLRFGFAKEMARGRIDDEKVASSAGVSQITSGPAAGRVLWSGSGGNPRLKPYIAVGTDLSWEKYFGKASYVGVDVFNKNLLNYIYTQTVVNYDFSGYTNTNPTLTPTSNIGSFTTPENGTGGRMEGLELQGGLEGGMVADALDGFGAQANFSLTNSSIPQSTLASIPGGPKTLPGLSRKVANLTLYYERNGFAVRVAERYRSSYTGEAVALFDQLGYTKILSNKETDFQASYDFSSGRYKGLSLLLQISNLTNTPFRSEQVSGLPNGVQVGMPLEYDTWGRTVLFGVSYKL
ncbi:TonB-dependent receptor [Dyella sp. A6]|uniref:TonB-dependent receptor n=1 Tax=Dyella aluminiiresistens TaxID=3069105 RepID=UPI002E75AB32|nr:TonB-dependent receptor [Dyella sp. A6]